MGKPVTHPYLPPSPSLQVHCGTPDKPATTKHFNPTGTWNLSKLCLKRKEKKSKMLCVWPTKSFSPNTGCLHREITSILCHSRANIVSERRVTLNPINGARPLVSSFIISYSLLSSARCRSAKPQLQLPTSPDLVPLKHAGSRDVWGRRSSPSLHLCFHSRWTAGNGRCSRSCLLATG